MIPAMSGILARLLLAKEFGYLTARSRAVIIEALMLTIVPAGPVPDMARRQLRLELLTLPWAWEHDRRQADALLFRGDLPLARVEDTAVLASFGRALAAELGDASRSEAVYRIMVALAYADGGSDRDVEALAPVGVALGVPKLRVMEIPEELKDDLVAAVVG